MGDEHPEQRDALTELVKSVVGKGKQWSVREFAERAVDPDTGWSPSKSLLGKIISGAGYKVEPRLVSALAVGFGLPREIVAAAAHWQVIGYQPEELGASAPVTLLRHLTSGDDRTHAQALARRWEADDTTPP